MYLLLYSHNIHTCVLYSVVSTFSLHSSQQETHCTSHFVHDKWSYLSETVWHWQMDIIDFNSNLRTQTKVPLLKYSVCQWWLMMCSGYYFWDVISFRDVTFVFLRRRSDSCFAQSDEIPFDCLCSNKWAGGGIFILAVYLVYRQTVFLVWHHHGVITILKSETWGFNRRRIVEMSGK